MMSSRTTALTTLAPMAPPARTAGVSTLVFATWDSQVIYVNKVIEIHVTGKCKKYAQSKRNITQIGDIK